MKELGYERALREWMGSRGMSYERHGYARSSGGEVVAYRLAPAGRPRGVVMPVHGAGNDALFSLPGLIKRLLSAGYEVFTFDVDGHGRHSTTRFHPDTAGGAVPEAIRESRAGARGLPLHGIGISLGGALLLHAVGAERHAFASAALLAAPLRIELSRRAVLTEIGVPALRTLWRERRHCGIWGMVPAFGPVKRGTYPLRLGMPSGVGSFGYVDVLNLALERLDLVAIAPDVVTPTLLAYGTADRVVPIGQGETLHGWMRSSELIHLEGETHLTTPLTPGLTARLLEWVGSHAQGGTVPPPAG